MPTAAKKSTTLAQDVSSLGLRGAAAEGWTRLSRTFPFLEVVRGAATSRSQARAMAQNVVAYGAIWINRTYKKDRNLHLVNRLAMECYEHALHNPKATVKELEDAFTTIIDTGTPAEQFALSHHMGGCAFDLHKFADRKEAAAIRAMIKSLPGLDEYIEDEGGQPKEHLQFVPDESHGAEVLACFEQDNPPVCLDTECAQSLDLLQSVA